MAEPKNIFDFGTGNIDKDQWLRDIDSEQDDFVSKYGMATNKHRTTLLRQAFQDLRTRIANGDMLNRTADGRYQFGSMLNRDDKHMQEAYERALGFMGDLARRQITTPPAEPEKKKYNTKTLNDRFIRFFNPSGNQEAFTSLWNSYDDNTRKTKLQEFLRSELNTGLSNYQDVEDYDSMDNLRTRISNFIADPNITNLNSLGFNKNYLSQLTTTTEEEEKPKSELEQKEEALAQQIDQFTRAQALKEKQQQLAWAQDADTFKGETFELQNFLPYDFEIDSSPYKTDQELHNFYDRSYNALDKYFRSLATNWRTIYSGGQGTRGMLGHNLAKLFSTFKDKNSKINYHFADLINKYFTPVQGGFLLKGTNEENDRNVYYVPGKGFTVTAHNKPWATISSQKEGGILKYQVGGGFNAYMAYRQAQQAPKQETKQQQKTEQKSKNPFDNWTAGDYALLGSAVTDIASAAASYVPGGQIASGILGAGSTLTSSVVDFKRNNVMSGLTNLVLGLGADVAGMLPVVGTAAKTAKIAKTISKLSKVLVPTFVAMGANSALSATRKLITGESLTPQEWQDLAQGIQLIISGGAKGVAGHSNSAFKRTQAEGVTHYDVKLEDGTTSRITREEFEGAKRNDYKGTAKQNIFGQVKGKPVVTREGIEKANKQIVSESLNPFNSITRRQKQYMQDKAGSQGYYIKNWTWPEWHPIQNRLKKIQERRLGQTQPVGPEKNYSDFEARALAENSPLRLQEPQTPLPWPDGTKYINRPKPLTKEQAQRQLEELRRSQGFALAEEIPQAGTYADIRHRQQEANILSSRYANEVELPTPTPRPTPGPRSKAFNQKYSRALRKKKYGGILKALRSGGILKADKGTKMTGINFVNGSSWYDNVFSNYKQNILDTLKSDNSKQYYAWLNDMQDAHHEIRDMAGGDSQSWIQTAYKNDAVKQYQTNYGNNRWGQNFNELGIAKANNASSQGGLPQRYDLGNNKRITTDNSKNNWAPDGLYSAITDDRRLLGKKGDYTPQQLEDFQNELKNVGYNLIEGTGGYYKLEPILASTPKPEQPTGDKKEGNVVDSAAGRKSILAPDYKNPFDPSLLISTAKYFAGLRGNRDIYQNLLDEMPEAPLRDPLDRKLAIVGWQERIKNGQNQLADLRRIQQMQQGFDQQTNFATALETERTGRDIMDKVFAEDSGRRFGTAQKLWNLDNEDILYNTGVGDANRRFIADIQRMMAQIRAAWRSGDQNLKMGLLADAGNLFMKRYQREQDLVDRAKELSLGTPEEWAQSEYTSRLGELANKKEADLTPADRAKIQAIKAQVMQDMRQNYSEKYYNLYHTPGFGGGYKWSLMGKNGSKLEVAKFKARSKDNDRYVSMIKDLRKRRKR